MHEPRPFMHRPPYTTRKNFNDKNSLGVPIGCTIVTDLHLVHHVLEMYVITVMIGSRPGGVTRSIMAGAESMLTKYAYFVPPKMRS